MDEPIGLIAGGGRLPVLAAQGMRAAGRRVVCVSLDGNHDPDLPPLCDRFRVVWLARMGSWVRNLRKFGASRAVMVGFVRKSKMYDPFRFFRLLPDLRTILFYLRRLRHDRRTNAMLVAVADELNDCGITLIDGTQFFPQHMAGAGDMTVTRASVEQWRQIERGWAVQQKLGELDISQAVAVCGERILAVEAIEGTDALIRRAGQLARGEPWTLIKAPKPNQDMRVDLPVIGEQTIENLKEAGGRCLAVATDKVIMVDKPALIAAADKAGIAIVGVRGEERHIV